MRKLLFFSFVIYIAFLLSGCSQKVTVKVLEPAYVDRVSTTKKIAVMRFDNDKAGLSSKIETNLVNYKIDSKPFFTVVDRKEIFELIEEQKIQNSGLVDIKGIVQAGELIGAQALVSGEVLRPSVRKNRYYESRVACVDKKCKKTYTYNVSCVERFIDISANVKIIDVAKGDVFYAETITRNATNRYCSDNHYTLPSVDSVINTLSSKIANEFTKKLTPTYNYFEVKLLEDPDLDYDDRQKSLHKNALKYIKNARYDKATQLLKELIDSTKQQSYVAFYNLGVIKEAMGEYEKAKKYYKKADSLTIEPVEEIDDAYRRIFTVINQNEMSKEQLGR